MSEIYSERCGALWGQSYWVAWNSSWPFTKVYVSRNSIELDGLFLGSFCFTRQDIKELRIYQGFLGSGIRIIHSRKDYQEFILFAPTNMKRAKRRLDELGYSVKEQD
jgi:hypothetical protein